MDIHEADCGHEILETSPIYIHKCLGSFCSECKEGSNQQCQVCRDMYKDDDLIKLEGVSTCEHDNTCLNEPRFFCYCVSQNLCEPHLIHVHGKIITSKRCTPKISVSTCETPCIKCDKFIATHVNEDNNELLCEGCVREHGLTRVKHLNKNSSENVKHDHDFNLFKSAVEKRLALQLKRCDAFKNEIKVEENKCQEMVKNLGSIIESCTHDNRKKLESLESSVNYAQKFMENLTKKEHEISSYIDKNKANIAEVENKLKPWVKQLLQSFETPVVNRVIIDFQEKTNDHVTRINLRPVSNSIQEDILPCNQEASSSMHTFAEFITRRAINQCRDHFAHTEPCGEADCYCRYYTNRDSSSAGPSTSKRAKTTHATKEHDEFDPCVYTDEESEPEYDESDHGIVAMNRSIEMPHSSPLIRLENTQEIMVKITYLRCPLWFFLEIPEMVEIRAKIMNDLNDPSKLHVPVLTVKQHSRVLVKDRQGFGPRMKRALIKSYNMEKGTWLVKFIDFGNDVNVKREQIHELSEEYQDIDSTCFRACLMGVKPRSNFCFTQKVPRNATSHINKYLLEKSGRVLVTREYQTMDDATFCKVSSFIKNKKVDWAKELCEANLALPVSEEPKCFLASENFCYLFHYFMKCHETCERVHKCPFCSENHALGSCQAYHRELITKESKRK